jgi:hypothetical protein
MKSVRFGEEVFMQNHAVIRGIDREISKEEILAAIDHPTAICKIQARGRLRIQAGNVSVIVEKKHDGLHVVTVFYRKRRKSDEKNSSP